MVNLLGTIPDRLQPQNVEAEEATLGALLIDPDTIIRVVNIIEGKDFFIERHSWVFEAIKSLHERREKVDLLILSDELERLHRLDEIGGTAYLSELINRTPSASGIEGYAKRVKRASFLRQVIGMSGALARYAFKSKGATLEEITADVLSIITPVVASVVSKSTVFVSESVQKVLDAIEWRQAHPGELVGLPTGLADLDKLLGGLRRKVMTIIAARPAMGKTTLALCIAMFNAKKGRRVALFSLEMPHEQLTTKLIAMESGIDSTRIDAADIKDDEWPAFLQASKFVSSLPIVINDTSGWTVAGLRAEALKMSQEGLDLLIIDYIQLMRGSGKKGQNREQEISEISRGLVELSKELGIPILVLAQLNRDPERRHNKRPMLSDLRESGSLEQDSAVVVFIYRDEVYNPDTEYVNLAELIVAKHRFGPTGSFSVYFRKHLSQFLDLEVRRKPLD